MANDNEQASRVPDAIAADMIAKIVIALVLDTPGVARLTGSRRSRREDDEGRAKSAKFSKSVRIVIKNDILSINMRIITAFGRPIPEIARKIQNDTKSRVEKEFPYLNLAAVNVWVDGVSFD